MKNLIKDFKQWRNERTKRLQLLKGNREYLYNAFLDAESLHELFRNIPDDREVVLWSLDGIKIVVKPAKEQNQQRSIHWDRDYD